MLAFFRKKKGYLNWTLWLMIPLLGAGMVLLFVDAPTGSTPGALGAHVATVAGEPIPTLAFRETYQNLVDRYRDQFGDQFNQIAPQLRLGDQAVNALVTEYAVAHEAERLGLSATPDEVREKIVSFPVFRDPAGNFIGVQQYEEILLHNNLTPAMFEGSVRRQLLREKLQGFLTDGLEPTEDEIREEFAKQSRETRVSYVYFDSETTSVGDVSDEELKEFFEANSDAYKRPERRKVSYLTVPVEPSKVQIPEDALQARIEGIPEVERVRASHILIRTPTSGEDAEARKRAGELLAQIRRGADFAELARANSEDETSATKGGDLGFFERGMMVPEFEQVAFAQEAGQVSDLVKTPFGIHIVKTTAKPRTSIESRRAMAEFEVRAEEAGRVAKAKADALLARWKEGATLEELGAEEGIRTGQTDYFGLNDNLAATLPVRADFIQQVFTLQPGEFNDPYAGNVSYVVARLDEIDATELPDFESVREQLAADYREQKKSELAKEKAMEFFRMARSEGLAEAAEKEGLEVTTTEFFKSGVNVDDILKFSPVMHDWVPKMEVGEVAPPVTVAGKLVVFEVVEKTPLDEEAYAEQKEAIAAQLTAERRNSFFASYIQNVVDRMRQEEQIQIDRAVMDELVA